MSTGRRLLLVDDETGILELLKMAFHDFVVATAVNVESAIDLLGEGNFDAMITDVRMPGGSGLLLIDHARAVCPGIAIFVMTGHHQAVVSDNRIAQWLFKPFSVRAVRQTVVDELARRAS